MTENKILTAQDIADWLRISRRRVYELMDLKPEFGGIPNFSVGTSRRVLKEDLETWVIRQFENNDFKDWGECMDQHTSELNRQHDNFLKPIERNRFAIGHCEYCKNAIEADDCFIVIEHDEYYCEWDCYIGWVKKNFYVVEVN